MPSLLFGGPARTRRGAPPSQETRFKILVSCRY